VPATLASISITVHKAITTHPQIFASGRLLLAAQTHFTSDTDGGQARCAIMALPPAIRNKILVAILMKLLLLLQDAGSSSFAQTQLLSMILTNQASLIALAVSHANVLVPRASPEVWAYPRQSSFTDTYLIGSYSAAMFKNRVRVSKPLFQHLCEQLGPRLHRETTNFRKPIPVETRIAASLYRLGHTCSASIISDMFGIGTSTVSPLLWEFVSAVLEELKSIYVRPPSTEEHLQKLADDFQKIRGILGVIGAIDGSHIPVSKPKEWAPDYYNRKGFYSVLLQGVVDAQSKFWDYDIGWAGSLHDYNLFKRTDVFRGLLGGQFGAYALLGDAAYQPRSYMLTPFLGSKEGLSREQYFWNFIQSSSRMPVECAFGILKMRWACLLLRLDLEIHFLVDVVAACIVLHNMCRVHGESFDEDWVTEVLAGIESVDIREGDTESRAARDETVQEIERGRAAVDTLTDTGRHRDSSRADGSAVESSRDEGIVVEQVLLRELAERAPGVNQVDFEEERGAYEQGKQKRHNLARVLYDADCRRKVKAMYGLESDEELDLEEDCEMAEAE
jgi:hypothetical protein